MQLYSMDPCIDQLKWNYTWLLKNCKQATLFFCNIVICLFCNKTYIPAQSLLLNAHWDVLEWLTPVQMRRMTSSPDRPNMRPKTWHSEVACRKDDSGHLGINRHITECFCGFCSVLTYSKFRSINFASDVLPKLLWKRLHENSANALYWGRLHPSNRKALGDFLQKLPGS